ANIGYVSSAGLRVLLATAKQLDGGRGVLRLCRLNGTVQEVFDVAGFSRMFAIFPTREAALGAPPPGGAKASAAVSKSADAALARQVAALLGAGESDVTPSEDSADLARSAAQLLDAGSKPPRGAEDKPAPAPKPPPPAAVPPPPNE